MVSLLLLLRSVEAMSELCSSPSGHSHFSKATKSEAFELAHVTVLQAGALATLVPAMGGVQVLATEIISRRPVG